MAKKRKAQETVCDQLRAAIKASELTQYALAKRADVNPEVVYRFMSGERDLRAKTFAKLALALGLRLAPTDNQT